MKQISVTILLLVSLVSITPRLAFAGYWQITYAGAGTSHVTSSAGNTTTQWPTSSWNGATYYTAQGDARDAPPGSVISTAGSVAATLTWIPSQAGDTPSQTGTLIIAENATAAIGFDGDPPDYTKDVMSGSADNGFSDRIQSTYDDYGHLWDLRMSGTYLTRVSIQSANGTWIAQLPSRHFSATMTMMQLVGDHQDAWMYYAVSIDSRAISLGANIDATNKKVPALDASGNIAIDANGDQNFTSAPNTTAYGSGHGDTIRSYKEFFDGPDNSIQEIDHINWVTFTPNFIGSWHWVAGTNHEGMSESVPNIFNPNTWSWTPNESEDEWDFGKCSMPFAANYEIDHNVVTGHDAPSTYNVTYKATDNTDGAQCSASYMMAVHDPYESNYTDHTQDMVDVANAKKLSDWGTIAGYNGATISASITTENPWSVKVGFSGEIPLPWLGSALSLDIEHSVTGDDKVGQSVSANDTHTGDYSYAEGLDHYTRHFGKVDTYSVSGYTGTKPYQLWYPTDPAHLLRLHRPYGNASSGPSPTH